MKFILSNVISRTIIPLAILISLAAFLYSYVKIGEIARQSQTYNRYTSCVLSIPALERDQTRIDKCWTVVQEDTGEQVKRYDRE